MTALRIRPKPAERPFVLRPVSIFRGYAVVPRAAKVVVINSPRV